jgi:uncharacterized protein YidB (DUF937 family)
MDMTGVTNLLKQHGPAIATHAVGLLNSKSGSSSGLSSVVEGFTKNGLGQQASSWVGTGENQPVSPDQVKSALGTSRWQRSLSRPGYPRTRRPRAWLGCCPSLSIT